ncbi:MAG: hypothetical protein JXR64_02855 [Spirochaetales bacterium]|nr:hypothetical protein [Spirochaetales bacterium]
MKIYLSKSNKAAFSLVAKLREELTNNKIEISEYEGGKYDFDKLSDGIKLIFIITHPEGNESIPNIAYFGRGIYSEYIKSSENNVPAYLYDGEYCFQIIRSKLMNQNDYMFKWAKIQLNNTPLTVEQVLTLDNGENM